MEADAILMVKSGRSMQGLTAVLKSTACEWFLIFLLIINAIFAYLSTKFARYCQLEIPCILCSRLDHVLGGEKSGCYRNMLCRSHKSEISSLVSCSIHGKLADGQDMCDECLLSFFTRSNPNPKRRRAFLGKLGFDLTGNGPQSALLRGDVFPGSPAKRLCSCCNKPWTARHHEQRLLHLRSSPARASKPNIPLPHRFNHQDNLKKIRDRFSARAVPPHYFGNNSSNPSSDVEYYSDVNVSSDSESEFPFSEEDDHKSIVKSIDEAKGGTMECNEVKYPTHEVPTQQYRAELNSQKAAHCTSSSPLHQLNPLDNVSHPSNTSKGSTELSPISQRFNASAQPEPLSQVGLNSSLDAAETPINKTANVTRTTDPTEKLQNTTAGASVENDQISSYPHSANLTYEDPNDVPKTAVSDKEKMSGIYVEQPAKIENDRITQDTELPKNEYSSAEGITLSSDDRSHDVQENGDDTDCSTCHGIQYFKKSTFPDGTESIGLESLGGSIVSEIEGESTLDRLKRQVEYDRKCMDTLYKELDAERNASAIAADEAMAMITKLQEEKAALHMEALQYLRMMEEQAEYDVEELEKANDLVTEKEKEIQDLEAELDYYRFKYPDDVLEAIYEDARDPKMENINVENKMLNRINHDADVSSDGHPEVSEGSNNPNSLASVWAALEEEKQYILLYLKSLESKLKRFASHENVPNVSKNGHIEEAKEEVNNQGENPDNGGTSRSHLMEENNLSVQTETGNPPLQEESNASISEDQFTHHGNNVSNVQKNLDHYTEEDLASLAFEISDLNERLDALEVDCNLIEHTCNMLQTGNEGIQFIREIAQQLQELRSLGKNIKSQSAA